MKENELWLPTHTTSTTKNERHIQLQLQSFTSHDSSKIKTDLEKWSAKLNRARERDEDRLKNYYGTISSEIATKIKNKNLEGEDKDKELARIEATNRELERKLEDIKERYTLKVSAELYSAIVLHLPTVHITCTLQKRKQKEI